MKKGTAYISSIEYTKFHKGDTLWGSNSNAKEIKRWSIEQEKDAIKELTNYHCEYRKMIASYFITEYALEFCECNDEGEFIQGSDYKLADIKTM